MGEPADGSIPREGGSLIWKTRTLWSSLRSRSAGGVLFIAGGTAFSAALAAFFSPILTRLYSASDFGMLSVFSSVIGVVTVISALRYEVAIPLPAVEQDGFTLVALSLSLVGVTSLLTGAVLAIAGGKAARLLGEASLVNYWWLLPIAILAAGVYRVLSMWALRQHEFLRIGRTRVMQGLGTIGLQLGMGAANLTPLGLLMGQAVGQGIGTSSLLPLLKGKAAVRLLDARRLLYEYRRFPMYSTWAALANALSYQLPVVLIASFFGSKVTGYYALGVWVLQAPTVLIGQAVGQVFHARASAAQRNGTLDSVVRAAHRRLLQTGAAAYLLLGATAPIAFRIVYGEQWVVSGEYVRWLTPWLLFVYVGSPISTLPAIVGRQGQELGFQLVMLCGRAAALAIGGYYRDATLAIALFGGISAALWAAYLFWNLRIAGLHLGDTAGEWLREVGLAMLLVAPAALASLVGRGELWLQLTLCGTSCLLVGARMVHTFRRSSSA